MNRSVRAFFLSSNSGPPAIQEWPDSNFFILFFTLWIVARQTTARTAQLSTVEWNKSMALLNGAMCYVSQIAQAMKPKHTHRSYKLKHFLFLIVIIMCV